MSLLDASWARVSSQDTTEALRNTQARLQPLFSNRQGAVVDGKEEGGGSREMHHGVRQCEGDGLGTMGILAAVLDQDNHSQHRSSHTEDSSHCQLLEGADPREQYERYGEYVDHVVCREVEGLPQRLSEEDYNPQQPPMHEITVAIFTTSPQTGPTASAAISEYPMISPVAWNNCCWLMSKMRTVSAEPHATTTQDHGARNNATHLETPWDGEQSNAE
eukprot:CAMPEP_0173185676 /NCGR_PEP_ID=MMETSP1141-20130122/9692_1 /TAXON_ID=483371 /ORGANISM="non described non described, Strain CCMP2298" /LENGTH=217 /DNA_ID=CAMNT_0014109241 /DNA_START=743 /DNA_END=1395 /DNA_ORIENTATION=+